MCQGTDENVKTSFDRAVAAGFDYLETDLRMTSDGHIVLCHDLNLQRIAGIDIDVSSSTCGALAKVTLNHGNKLLFLEAFLSLYPDKGYVFDIKPETGHDVVEHLDEYVIDFDRCYFLFWDIEQQRIFQRKYPQGRCFARLDECRRAGWWSCLGLAVFAGIETDKVYALPPKMKGFWLYRKALLARYQSCDAKVLAYLPQSQQACDRALSVGVDFVLSDHDFLNR